jgi:gliding motility-associated-like protein
VFTAGEAITLRATASDVNGTISRVEFFDGTTKLGEDLTSPYTLVWNNASVGNHLITARATDNSGSTASDEIQIFVNARNENPTAHAGEDVQISLPVRDYTINGTASDADGVITNYLWTLVSGPEDITFTQDTFGKLVITTSVAGTYVFELTVTDNGNNTGSDQITITVTPSLLSLEQIPRYFSPNNDGINDVWEWPSIELYENALLLIFNRFGQKIFETMAYQNNWDGTLNGKPLQEDAYYYIIRLANTDLKGAVRIVR